MTPEMLERIAHSLEQIASARDKSWIAIVTAAMGVLLGYALSQLNDFKQQKRLEKIDKMKRRWIRKLLDDEIKLRWQKNMAPAIMDLADPKNPDAAEEFTSRMVIRPQDLIILSLISSSPYDYYFIDNPEVMSQIIHTHVQICDLIDFREIVKRDLAEGNLTWNWQDDLKKRLESIGATLELIRRWEPATI